MSNDNKQILIKSQNDFDKCMTNNITEHLLFIGDEYVIEASKIKYNNHDINLESTIRTWTFERCTNVTFQYFNGIWIVPKLVDVESFTISKCRKCNINHIAPINACRMINCYATYLHMRHDVEVQIEKCEKCDIHANIIDKFNKNEKCDITVCNKNCIINDESPCDMNDNKKCDITFSNCMVAVHVEPFACINDHCTILFKSSYLMIDEMCGKDVKDNLFDDSTDCTVEFDETSYCYYK